MFTGIVERSVPVMHVLNSHAGLRLVLPNVWAEVRHGESISVNGVCLTVAEHSAERLSFDVIKETLDRTNLGQLRAGDEAHVERSLRVGDRFDGHIVQGHVDGTARVLAHTSNPGDWRVSVEALPWLMKYLIPKGSITLDGVSLTVATIDEKSFEVALIPTTLDLTRLGQRPVGWPLNVECDMMVKTVVATLEKLGVGSGECGAKAFAPHSQLHTPHST